MNRLDSAVDRIIEQLARRAGARRALTVLASLLVIFALGTLAYPVYTDFYHNDLQGHLRKELRTPSIKAAYLAGTLQSGQSLTRLQIPRLGVDVVVVQGVDTKALEAGAGHYPTTPLPCEAGNVAIAGHRTTYGKPFANVDRLRAGDQIILTTPVGSCVYRVSTAPFVVLPDDVSVIADTPGQYDLTLTACHPKGSASHRIIIRAAMVSSSATL